jgi:hypothetical protein
MVSFVLGVTVFGGRLTENSCFCKCVECYGFRCYTLRAVSGMNDCDGVEGMRE